MRQSKPHLHRGYYRCRIDGTEHHLGKDKRAAMRRFHELMKAKLAEAGETGGPPRTVNGAIVAWMKLNKPFYRNWLIPFGHFTGELPLDDVGRDLLTRYQIHLKGQNAKRWTHDPETKTWDVKDTGKPLAAGTIRHYVRAAGFVLKWAAEQGWIPVLPAAPKLSTAVRQARDLDGDTLTATFNRLDGRAERAGRILRFIAATGCRPGEACRLTWENVHLDRGICVLPDHKTAEASGKPKTIYLTPDAETILADLQADANRKMSGKPSGPVFLSGDGVPYKPGGLRSIMRRHSGGKTPYALRHTFAQTGSDSGLAPDVLAKLLGHTSTKTTAFYYDVADARALQAARSLKPRQAANDEQDRQKGKAG